MSKSEYPTNFEAFWSAYPRKVAKPAAMKAWEKQKLEGDMFAAKAAINDAEKRTRLKWWNDDATKIPHPATWINARRWEDEGWENETKTNHKVAATGRSYHPQVVEPPVPWFETCLNHEFLAYAMASCGLPDTVAALAIRDRLIRDEVPALVDGIAAGTDTLIESRQYLAGRFRAEMDRAYKRTVGEMLQDRAKRSTDNAYRHDSAALEAL